MPIRPDIDSGPNDPSPLKLGFVVRVKGLSLNFFGVTANYPDWREGDVFPELTPQQVKAGENSGCQKWTI